MAKIAVFNLSGYFGQNQYYLHGATAMVDILVDRLFDNVQKPDQASDKLAIPGYFVRSTARANVEDIESIERDETAPNVQSIIEDLYNHRKASLQELENSKPSKALGLVVSIHGYNTGGADNSLREPPDPNKDGVFSSYQKLCRYVNNDACIKNSANRIVYIGYRWPSETIGINWESVSNAFKALPAMLRGVLAVGVFLALGSLLLLVLQFNGLGELSPWFGLPTWVLFSPILLTLVIGVAVIAIIFSMFALRVSVYFRDSYRATNYGVPDLVELIRQLDQGLLNKALDEKLLATMLEKPAYQALDPQALTQVISIARKELTLRRSRKHFRETVTNQLKGDPKFQFLFEQTTFPQGPDTILSGLLTDLHQEYPAQQEAAQTIWEGNPIKLSFIAHSMGAHVTTQVIRILSDVFDPSSIGSIGGDQEATKKPTSEVGHVFSLGRLVLISPDIPSLAIQSGRSNFLRSSLRRFEETYLFSNEGDLALRLASTAANYFSFPARSRDEGYRLGNVTINPQPRKITPHPESSAEETLDIANPKNYGIVNLQQLPNGKLLRYLEINVLNKDKRQSLDPALQRLRDKIQKRQPEDQESQKDRDALADLFTFFDCTEYRDYTDYQGAGDELHNVLIKDKQSSPLSLGQYVWLTPAYFSFSESKFLKGARDTHGGYFYGKFSQLLIYRLAFVGFGELLDCLLTENPIDPKINVKDAFPKAELEEARMRTISDPNQTTDQARTRRKVALEYLSWICEQKRLQVVLSPRRYLDDVVNKP